MRSLATAFAFTSIAVLAACGADRATGVASEPLTSDGASLSSSIDWPNQPGGLTLLTERPFSAVQEGGWAVGSTANAAVASDLTAPRSAPSVLRITYPAGMYAGGTPLQTDKGLGSSSSTVYLSFWTKLSPNFYGQPSSGSNKLLYLWLAGRNRAFVAAHGTTTGALRPVIGLSQIVSNGGYATLTPNLVPSAEVVRGQWQRWEVVAKVNSAGYADGSVDWWIDGVKVGHYDGIQFVSASQSHTWELLQLSPTWGSGSGTVPATQYLWLDHLYASGGTASTTSTSPTAATVSTVSVSASGSTTLYPGQTTQLSATVRDSAGNVLTDRTVTWSSSAPAVATVSASGLVSAVAAGTATLTATVDGKSGSVVVTVNTVRVASVSVTSPVSSLAVGASTQLSAVVRDSAGQTLTGRSVTWSSSNTAVATVGADGTVRAVAPGTVTVTATSDGVSGSATLSVVQAAVASVSVTSNTSTLTIGQGTQLSLVLRDAAGNVLTNRAVAWTSSAASVASVSSSGYVSALSAGSTTITATSEGVSGSVTLSVQQAPVASVTVTSNASSLTVGQGTQLSVTLRDAAGNVLTNRAVTWQSSAPAVASVSSSGYVSALSAGSAAITATSEGVRGSVTISVTAPVTSSSPTSTSWPNEPTGSMRLTERGFSAISEDNWLVPSWSLSNLSVVSDASAPRSAPSTVRARFPVGMSGGNSPIVMERQLSGGATTLYSSFWVRFSDNWVGHESGVNKILHFWIGGINRVTLSATGSGSGTLVPQVRLQQIQNMGGYVNLSPNLAPGAQIVRGRWHRWELVLRANSGSNTDGVIEWWIDGVKVGSHSGIEFVNSTQGHTWDVMKWDPTWGGMGGTLPVEQYQWMDHLYISGR